GGGRGGGEGGGEVVGRWVGGREDCGLGLGGFPKTPRRSRGPSAPLKALRSGWLPPPLVSSCFGAMRGDYAADGRPHRRSDDDNARVQAVDRRGGDDLCADGGPWRGLGGRRETVGLADE